VTDAQINAYSQAAAPPGGGSAARTLVLWERGGQTENHVVRYT